MVAGIAAMMGAPAVSAEGLYAGGNIGFSGGGGEYDNSGLDMTLAGGFILSSYIGKEFDNARLEGELTYRQNDLYYFDFFGPLVGDMSSLAFMANAYYDFGSKSSTFRPYIGIGLGMANVTMNSVDYATYDTDAAVALQIMIGGSIALSDGLAMTVDLRSFGAVPTFVDIGGFQYEQAYGVASLMVGVRQSF